jgi:AraC-like DNA-binding protein
MSSAVLSSTDIATCVITHQHSQEYQEYRLLPTSLMHRISFSNPLLNKVFSFIEEHYQQTISLQDVAQAVGYSSAYLTDLVRQQTGKPVHSWIIERRMIAARALLLETNQAISHIAEAVGYQDATYFFRQFRQRHGVTPQVWRNSQRGRNQK